PLSFCSTSTATTALYSLSLHDALPIYASQVIAISESALGYFQSLDAGKTWSTITTTSSCGGVNTIFFDAGSTLSVGGTAGLCRSDRKSTRLNSSHDQISYAVFCLKKKK